MSAPPRSASSDRSRDTRSVQQTDRPPLTERERRILQLVVQHFIDTAGPVGSRSLARQFDIGLSPASIRNTMADLEDMGYLDHPYTSAGRMPTQMGYRTFVDELMQAPKLSDAERQVLKMQLAQLVSDTDEMLRESTKLLSKLSNLLGVALSPRLSTGVLERLDIVPLTGPRLLFVLNVSGGLVKTIVLDFEADVDRSDLDRIVSMLNERLAGLTLAEIRDTHEERVRDLDDSTGIVDLMQAEATPLFSEPQQGRLQLGGARNLLNQPEFQETDDIRHFFELLEDEALLIDLLENLCTTPDAAGNTYVRIGSGNDDDEMASYSIVVSPYRMGSTVGTLGLMGPTRMNYPRAVALVQTMADVLNRSNGDDSSGDTAL
ncbi:heat-inducible transcription repressor HrcA [Longimonas halophila]|uniref:Heat-inducible transcription repressor HrcA n=1 Tax=Longimonas halophila TaxID=1469170 RepID=A0A2H3NKM9_9BACT|nr:heat-inducible transcriptional repressor HrcA [Longimonas halophila]PEN06560.1 heat-inducible transcription repressor HrcA [Longimonas halophila]